jgi:hypothetical protein
MIWTYKKHAQHQRNDNSEQENTGRIFGAIFSLFDGLRFFIDRVRRSTVHCIFLRHSLT